MWPPAKAPLVKRGGREAAGGFPLPENIYGALLLSVGAHSVRPRAAEVVGPYGVYRTGFCIFVGAGVLTRPPFPSARLEPRRRQRRFQKGEFQAFDYFPVSGSERRGESGQLSDPRLCDDCQARLIGGPRKMGVQGGERHGGRGGADAPADCAYPRCLFGFFLGIQKEARRRSGETPQRL